MSATSPKQSILSWKSGSHTNPYGLPTIGDALAQGRRSLETLSDTPRLDAELLLCEALGCTRTYVYAHPERQLEAGPAHAYGRLLHRRLQGESVAVIRGIKEFWTLELAARQGVLVPRPETEVVVELTLTQLEHNPRARVADLGTGTGAIALALGCERPQWHLVASDVDPTALELARHNAARLGIANVRFVRTNWLQALDSARFDLIVSNPPYIREGDPCLDDPTLAQEPVRALIAGKDGLRDIEIILEQASQGMKPGGVLILEHGHDQGAAVRALFAKAGFEEVTTHKDLGRRDRATLGRRPL